MKAAPSLCSTRVKFHKLLSAHEQSYVWPGPSSYHTGVDSGWVESGSRSRVRESRISPEIFLTWQLVVFWCLQLYHFYQALSETANIGRFDQIWVFGLEYVKLNFQLNGHLILGPWGPTSEILAIKEPLGIQTGMTPCGGKFEIQASQAESFSQKFE